MADPQPLEFEESFAAWRKKVIASVKRANCENHHDAEDAAQQAFEKLVPRWIPGQYSANYVGTVAANIFKREMRRYPVQVRNSLDDLILNNLLEGQTDPQLSRWETEEWCEYIFSELTRPQREVMECFVAGLSTKETSAKLAISEDVVRRRLCDARKSLRKTWPRDDEDSESPRPTAPATVRGRRVSRAVDRAVDISASLAVPYRAPRAMSLAEQEEAAAKSKELRALLIQCPAGAFGPAGSSELLANVAAAATARISDRNEQGAWELIRPTHSHLEFAPRRPSACDLRRARAEALCELGYPRWAESLLRGLAEIERQIFGAEHPRTRMLRLWARAMNGHLIEAARGFRDLEARLAQSEHADSSLLWHVQCRHFWLLGACGNTDESASGYDSVILNRSHNLGSDDKDTMDGGHSKGKMLVVNNAGVQAIPILQAVVDQRARVQGEGHSDTLESLKYLRLAQYQAEPRDDRVLNNAIGDLEQILDTLTSRHGPDYPMSRDTAAWLKSLRGNREAVRFGEPLTFTRLTGR